MDNSSVEEEVKEALKQFYTDFGSFLIAETQGELDDSKPWASSSTGICANLVQWLRFTKQPRRVEINILTGLIGTFTDAGLNKLCPFNEGNMDKYRNEFWAGDMYKNPARIAWVFDHGSEENKVKYLSLTNH